MKGRDPSYQKLAVEGLIKSSARVLSITKNEEKKENIQEGVKILEEFLEIFAKENRAKNNMPYLNIELIRDSIKKGDFKLHSLEKEFLNAYEEKAEGNYKNLRTIYCEDDEVSWDIIRNKKLDKLSEAKSLFNENGHPTSDHFRRIVWAFSPQPDKLKSYTAQKTSKRAAEDDEDVKRKKK